MHGKVLYAGHSFQVCANNIYSKWIIVVSCCYMNQDQCRLSSVAKRNAKSEDHVCVARHEAWLRGVH
jgi:hypothetical protein